IGNDGFPSVFWTRLKWNNIMFHDKLIFINGIQFPNQFLIFFDNFIIVSQMSSHEHKGCPQSVCNPETGKWVVASGSMGKQLKHKYGTSLIYSKSKKAQVKVEIDIKD